MMQTDKELTDKLGRGLEEQGITLEQAKERFLRIWPGIPVVSYEALLSSGKTGYWGHNAYAYTSLSFEDVIRCLNFTNPPNIDMLRQKEQGRHNTDRVLRNFPMLWTAEFWLTRSKFFKDFELTDNDADRIGLTADIRMSELDRQTFKDIHKNSLEKSFGTKPIKTLISQPGGRTEVPGTFFNILYQEALKTEDCLFILQVYENKEYDLNKDSYFVVAHLPHIL